jgi:hypothetical protein
MVASNEIDELYAAFRGQDIVGYRSSGIAAVMVPRSPKSFDDVGTLMTFSRFQVEGRGKVGTKQNPSVSDIDFPG